MFSAWNIEKNQVLKKKGGEKHEQEICFSKQWKIKRKLNKQTKIPD